MSRETQRRLALQRANEVRHGYVELKRALGEGEVDLAEAMDDPRANGPLTIGKLLCAQPEIGPRRMRRLLIRTGIQESVRIENLSAIQRRYIVEAVRYREVSVARERARKGKRLCTRIPATNPKRPISRRGLGALSQP